MRNQAQGSGFPKNLRYLLQWDFTAEQPNTKWVADTTYIWTAEGWLYLAVVLDLFSRMVVGWSMAATQEATLVVQALHMAITRRRPQAGLLHHSDRGSTYTSESYQALLEREGMVVSMSRTADCYDTHHALLEAGIWIIEGLNLSNVEPGIYELICLPLKIEGSDGAPSRAILRFVEAI